jgi:DnaJ-class molecular chaperone
MSDATHTTNDGASNMNAALALTALAALDYSQIQVACPKCAGWGYFPEYRHIEHGKCFRCDGTGKVALSTIPKKYQAAALDQAMQEQDGNGVGAIRYLEDEKAEAAAKAAREAAHAEARDEYDAVYEMLVAGVELKLGRKRQTDPFQVILNPDTEFQAEVDAVVAKAEAAGLLPEVPKL